jgi:hypothetical protein
VSRWSYNRVPMCGCIGIHTFVDMHTSVNVMMGSTVLHICARHMQEREACISYARHVRMLNIANVHVQATVVLSSMRTAHAYVHTLYICTCADKRSLRSTRRSFGHTSLSPMSWTECLLLPSVFSMWSSNRCMVCVPCVVGRRLQ